MISGILNITPISLRHFTWNKQSSTLCCEASDLGPTRRGRWWLQRLFNDAADVGIAIQSHVTSRIELFYLDREHVHEGDLLAWYFKPVDSNSPVKCVTIFND